MARQRTNQASQVKSSNEKHDSSKQTFLEHLYELRKRLFWIVLTLVFTTAVGLEIKDQLIAVVMAPLKGGKLVYLTPGGGFNFIFTLSLYFGVLFTIPVISYQIYRFLQPMLQDTSRRFVMIFIAVSSVLAALGAALAYFLAIPGALGFLSGFAGSSIVPNLTADSYLNFVVTYTVGMAALFQLPLLLFLFDHIRPIPPGILAKSQRYGIVATTVLAGLITPSPDLLNYSIVLFPILGAYECGVLAVYARRRFFRTKTKVETVKAEPKTVAETEPINDEAPLTAIMEEMADHPQPVEVAVPPQPKQAVAVSAPQYTPVQHPAYYAPEAYGMQAGVQAYPAPQSSDPPVVGAQAVQQPMPLTPQASRGRSLDSIRVAARYKTNVHVPKRDHGALENPQTASGQSEGDGLLTAEA